MKVGLISLGCFKNQVDAEKILFKLIVKKIIICYILNNDLNNLFLWSFKHGFFRQ